MHQSEFENAANQEDRINKSRTRIAQIRERSTNQLDKLANQQNYRHKLYKNQLDKNQLSTVTEVNSNWGNDRDNDNDNDTDHDNDNDNDHQHLEGRCTKK